MGIDVFVGVLALHLLLAIVADGYPSPGGLQEQQPRARARARGGGGVGAGRMQQRQPQYGGGGGGEYSGFDASAYTGFRIPYEGWECPVLTELPSQAFFRRDYVDARRPVVVRLRGGLGSLGWRPEGAWTDDFLCAQAGEEATVRVVVRPSADHLSSSEQIVMPLCKFLRERDPLKYVTQFQGPRGESAPYAPWLHRAFREHFSTPPFYNYDFKTVNMWIGLSSNASVATVTNAHFDGVDNLFVVLGGRKEFRLWDPTAAPGMYTHAPVLRLRPSGAIVTGEGVNPALPPADEFDNPFVLRRPKTSQVPLLRPGETFHNPQRRKTYSYDDIVKLFPLYANVSSGTCVGLPGDMVYFPGTFFHEVRSYGRHVGINFWFSYDRRLEPNRPAMRPT